MNKVILIGRLTKNPDVRYSQGEKPMAIASYSLAVDRMFKRDGEPSADFINCKAFGKQGEFAEKYLRKGMKIAVTGHIQTGSYTNRDGNKVYTTDVVVEQHEFCESRAESANNKGYDSPVPQPSPAPVSSANDFMTIPDNMEELPFN
ncbi:single-stranded DNA-binding protein [Eubacterium ramulus]